jgi:hypothetical protein
LETDPGLGPLVGAIVQDRHAVSSAAILAEICEGLARTINLNYSAEGDVVFFKTKKYKEQTIHQIAFSPLIDAGRAWELLGEMKAAFAVIDGQMVFGSNVSVIQDMIDARGRSDFALPLFAEWVREDARRKEHTRSRAYLNPAATARWLEPLRGVLEDTNSELLQSAWLQRLRSYFSDTPVQLGARLAKDDPENKGKIYVLDVLEGRPAYGKLRAGDFIVGIDGQWLAETSTRDDLRKKLIAKPEGGPRVLRIERYGKFKDVTIDLPRVSNKSFHGLLSDTSSAINYLKRLGEVVDHVSYRQYGSHSRIFQAEVVFHLKKP